jgi:hypothetical protein
MPHWLDKVIDLLKADTNDLRELARIAGGDPAIFYKGIELQDLEWEDQNIEEMEFSSSDSFLDSLMDGSQINIGVNENIIIQTDELTKLIKNFKRQEERISLVLRLILEHRHAAIAILEQYGLDQAKYATLAIAELLQALRMDAHQKSLFEEESSQISFLNDPPYRRLADDELAKIVQRTFNNIPPSNRSALLFNMAKHLSDFPEVNQFLRSIIEKSRSVFVTVEREQLLQLLDHPSSLSWMDLLGIPYEEEIDEPVHR